MSDPLSMAFVRLIKMTASLIGLGYLVDTAWLILIGTILFGLWIIWKLYHA